MVILVMPKADQERVVANIMWRRVDAPGHDACWLVPSSGGWTLEGSAVFLSGRSPCALGYRIECDRAFQTKTARVEGWLGPRRIDLRIRVDRRRRWRLNNVPVPAVDGCVDIDINFSPSTNLLSLRRLHPKVDENISVRAAWLAFPKLELQPLEQTYLRTHVHTYDYCAPSLDFSSRLTTDRNGFVVDYPPLWYRAVPKR